MTPLPFEHSDRYGGLHLLCTTRCLRTTDRKASNRSNVRGLGWAPNLNTVRPYGSDDRFVFYSQVKISVKA